MTDPSPPPAAEIRAELEKLALHQHMVIDGEYGCPGVTCPGVQKLITFAEAAFSLGAQTASNWQPMETCPKDEEVFFWVVPKLPEEAFTDTSGNPIFSTHAGYLHRGKWQSWGSLSKPTHWQKLPFPPAEAVQA